MTTEQSSARQAARYRATSGSLTPGSARAMLFTILGELVWPAGEAVRTATLLHTLTGLDFEEQTARQAIARAAASGWIEPERRGREVDWRLTPKIMDIFATGSARVLSMSRPFDDWDGQWLAVLPTIPQSHRKARRPLYAGLTWAGFGDPAPGLWLSPHVERSDEVSELIEALDLADTTVSFVGTLHAIGLPQSEILSRGWDLDALAQHYEAVLSRVERQRPADPDQTLLSLVRILNEWQEFPRTDPQLPDALLPDWIGRRVAQRIETLRQEWSPVASRRYAELNAG